MKKIILHIDINYFFAQVEEILNPKLKNKPVAVSPSKYKNIISASNYIAREKGVNAAQKTYDAIKNCNDLEIVEANMFRYRQFSKKFFDCIKNNFTDNIDCYSIDECFIDATKLVEKYHNNILILVNEIYKKIISETSLKTSIGIGENKFLAKTANDISDKKNFYNTLFKSEIREKLYDVPINKVFFVGKKTNEIFEKLNIFYVKDFINYKNKIHLKEILKSKYDVLINFFNGESSDVIESEGVENKSISLAETFSFSTSESEFIKRKIIQLANKLFYKMTAQSLTTKTFTLSIRNEFKKTISRSYTISKKITSIDQFTNVFIQIFNRNWENEMINQISLGVSKLKLDNDKKTKKQISLIDY